MAMDEALRRSWSSLAVRGIVAILLGIALFVWPSAGLVVLVGLFAAFALVDGVVAVYSAFRVPRDSRLWTILALEGVTGILAGLAALFLPGVTVVTLVFLAGAWSIVVGVLEIVGAYQFRKTIEHDWVYWVAGAVSVLFGVLLFLHPGVGAISLMYLIGFIAIAHGVVLFAMGMRLREAIHRVITTMPPVAGGTSTRAPV